MKVSEVNDKNIKLMRSNRVHQGCQTRIHSQNVKLGQSLANIDMYQKSSSKFNSEPFYMDQSNFFST